MNAQGYQNNRGKRVTLNQANAVTHQNGSFSNSHGYTGADGNFVEVFDSRLSEESDDLRIFNIQTLIGNYLLPAGTGRKVAILGRIEWGVGGASMKVDFDWKMGTQISIAASFIRVEAAYSEVVQTPLTVDVTALFSTGSRAARSQTTRTFPQLIISDDPGETVIVPIPPLAHALNVFALEPAFYTTGAALVRFVGGVSTDFSTATTDLSSFETDGVPFLQALANEDGVRFPEAARFVEFSVPVDGDTFHITPCFTLSL